MLRFALPSMYPACQERDSLLVAKYGQELRGSPASPAV